jgi:glucokinase
VAAESYSVGLDLGGTNLVAAAYSSKRGILVRTKVFTLAQQGPAKLLNRLAGEAAKVIALAELHPSQIKAVGLGSPGPLDAQRGVILDSPNIKGWKNIAVAQRLGAKLGRRVVLENDAVAAAIGEHRLGAGRGSRLMLMLTLGTGVGGAILVDGKPFRGQGTWAGEFGHMFLSPDGPAIKTGQRGTLEGYASATAIAARARVLMAKNKKSRLWALAEGDLKKVSSRLVHQAFKQRDALATQVWRETAAWLGLGLASLINIFNPERIVVAGGVMLGGSELLALATRAARSRALGRGTGCKIVKAALGDDAGVIGAAELGLRP